MSETLAEITSRGVGDAPLPVVYESAKAELQKCARVDECKTWADKAEAIRSYARQADDDDLMKMATRIKARAIERCGDLLREFDAPKTGRPKSKGGAPPTSPRQRAAAAAGLSRDQTKQALRVNAYATEDPQAYETAVESDDPPTVTELARRGTKKRPRVIDHLGGRDPEDFRQATHGHGAVRSLHMFIERSDVDAIARGLSDYERPEIVAKSHACILWLRTLIKKVEANAD